VHPARAKGGVMSEPFGPYSVILTLAARNQSRIDLVENTLVRNSEGRDRREVLKRILVVPGKEDNRELIEAEEQGAELQRQAHSRNPHIIEVYDSGRLNEYFFVSMEYVEGQNLEEYQRTLAGPLSPVEAACIARELCSQVATLHEFLLTVDGKSQAFLHNDIKPSNIQIRKTDNQIRLIDFGAAKSVTYSKNFTRNDFASVAYCSPERLQNGLSDTQTDLWSIAVVLYEMVAGGLPFRASSHQQLELLITSGAPPAALPESCPAGLQAIIYKALSAGVQDRYPDARAFGDDLQQFCAAPDKAPLKTPVTVSENPTRKVTVRPSVPALNQPATGTGSSRFNPTPASDLGAPLRSPSGLPAPLATLGAAIMQRPFRFGLRAALGIFALYVTLSAASAHHEVQGLYSSLENEDFPSLPLSDIDSQYKELQSLRESTFGRFFAFTSNLRTAIKPRLVETAERPINAYRTDQTHQPLQSDWLRAYSCLNFATEIDSSDKRTRAELDLVDGHLARIRKDYSVARQKFVEASSLAGDSPDPWIGLAWLDAYNDNNLQALISDQIKAQQNHYTPARREAAQRGDVSMILGRKAILASLNWRRKNSAEEETHFLHEADDDFVRAEKDYQGCRNWAHTEADIEEIHNRRSTIQQRLADLQRLAEINGGSK
jgi:serine/threonine protein kinase